ncbi:shikimate dehydrogenase [Hoeflea marina]|uniref:Shikimate dehydrogenase (NADP(+)) n=1 Tax=Hoeflea marina TaxID=274592 RepID=A0A317PNC0_9HYPH|nr:shikimate dehydrogenase [Hoeflea marina]PWW00547.1 shikimate dehydrogenase [Hoeflea marina]
MDKTVPPRAFVAGHPVRHSRSPLIHGHWLKTAGIPGSYEKLEIAPEAFGAFIGSMKDGSAPFVGGNVTIPHKEAVFGFADDVDETARLIGAANTVWLEEGRIRATNTDAYGFAANLDEGHPGWDSGATAVVLGAGGASRAVIHALLQRGFGSVRVSNRGKARAVELSDRFGPRVSALGLDDLPDLMAGADLFVNTTSLGMDGSDVPPIDFSPMAEGGLVTDIVYVPLMTPILAMARAQGRPTADGLGMLLHQAVPGFEIWFGLRPRVTPELRQLVIDDMEMGQ